MSQTLNGEYRKLGLDDRSQLDRILEHPVVVGDQSLIAELVKGQDELAIPDPGEPAVYLPNGEELNVAEPGGHCHQYRLREVVV